MPFFTSFGEEEDEGEMMGQNWMSLNSAENNLIAPARLIVL
jgi:hypothetical protein